MTLIRSASPTKRPFTIHTSLLFDPKQKRFRKNISITVNPDNGLITKVFERASSSIEDASTPASPDDIDLRNLTIIPGLSLTSRILRTTNHLRAALLAGYTTYRDLGTEGAFDADIGVRDSVNRGIIPGPRLYVATEAIASSGGYEIRQENRLGGTSVPRISDPADGPVGVRAAVRRRIGAGADVVKFYADYRKRVLRFPQEAWPGAGCVHFAPEDKDGMDRNPNLPLFTKEEMIAMVEEARENRAPIAAHSGVAECVIRAAEAGVTTIEHGNDPSEEAIWAMKEHGTIYVPTLRILELNGTKDVMLPYVKRAYDAGVKLAAGGDTGPVAHGGNVRELELMVEGGIPLEEALVAATVRGWEACGAEWCGRKFGWFEEGVAADVVGLRGDPRQDIGSLREVEFVMKDAKVWKMDGDAMGMV
ncbi:MAG: hypothetical protein M1820_000692 [Bogoriella megaspora]|nr:MAG: hypothetical protein M1820_000692 [Bogoriella megaspora]